jgi:methylated-DNA-[protein]-cysteine S-methyltransferase
MDDEITRALAGEGGGSFATAAAHAAGRLAAAADRQGLIDIALARVDSPLGTLVALGTERGLLMLSYSDESLEARLERVAARVSPRILEAPARLDTTRRELEEYFSGGRRSFDIPIDWSLITGYARAVLEATSAIPYGGAMSYGEVSAAAGNPRGARATGNALGSNPIPIVIPCHRVLRSGGAIGGYTGGLERKRFLLELERRDL